MKQILKQKTSLNLTPLLQKQIKFLALSGVEIREVLLKLIESHPEEEEESKSVNYYKELELVDKYRNFSLSGDLNTGAENHAIRTSDIRDKLREQFSLLMLKEYELLIGAYIIDSIEHEGALDPEIDFEDIKSLVREEYAIEIDTKKIEEILLKVQDLDPPGCAYRSITESLNAQIRNLEIKEELKKECNRAIDKISLKEITLDQIPLNIKKIIRALNFNPGLKLDTQSSYIKADVIGIKKNKKWHVSINDAYMQANLLERIKAQIGSRSSDEKTASLSIITGIERRQKTLLLVSEFLVSKQSDFLNGNKVLTSISLKQVAESTGVSESTASRIVRNKYIQLPDKILNLSSLLQRKVNFRSGGVDISSSQLLEIIHNLTRDENKKHPLSDKSLKDILMSEYSVNIARRTVAKYRKSANIPSSQSRRS